MSSNINTNSTISNEIFGTGVTECSVICIHGTGIVEALNFVAFFPAMMTVTIVTKWTWLTDATGFKLCTFSKTTHLVAVGSGVEAFISITLEVNWTIITDTSRFSISTISKAVKIFTIDSFINTDRPVHMNIHKMIWTVVADCSEFFLSTTIEALNIITVKTNIDACGTITSIKVGTRIAFATGSGLSTITKTAEIVTMET